VLFLCFDVLGDIFLLSRQNRPSSIEKILQLIEQSNHRGLEELLQNSSFVGSVNSAFCILQQGTKMYLVDYRKMSKEMFFQKILRCFSTFSEIYLDPPPSLFSLLELALECPEVEWHARDGPKDEIAKNIVEGIFCDIPIREILRKHFSIVIDPDSKALVALPWIVSSYIPDMSALPLFLIRLATEVNWQSEEDCFRSVALELSEFYATFPSNDDPSPERDDLIGQTLFPSWKTLKPPKSLSSDGSVVQIASLEKLYRIFERC